MGMVVEDANRPWFVPFFFLLSLVYDYRSEINYSCFLFE